MYKTFRDTDPLPRDYSLVDYGFKIDGPEYEELFSPSKALLEKREEG